MLGADCIQVYIQKWSRAFLMQSQYELGLPRHRVKLSRHDLIDTDESGPEILHRTERQEQQYRELVR